MRIYTDIPREFIDVSQTEYQQDLIMQRLRQNNHLQQIVPVPDYLADGLKDWLEQLGYHCSIEYSPRLIENRLARLRIYR